MAGAGAQRWALGSSDQDAGAGIQRPLRQPGLSSRAWSPQGHNPSGPGKVGKAGRDGEHQRGVVKAEAAWPKGEKTGCGGGHQILG